MNPISIAFYFVFCGNLFIKWGLSIDFDKKKHLKPSKFFVLVGLTVFISLLMGLLTKYVLYPLHLESLSPVLYVILMFGLSFLMNALYGIRKKRFIDYPYDDDIICFNMLIYTVAISSCSSFYSIWSLLSVCFASVCGFFAVWLFMDAIIEKLELEPIPIVFRGWPIRLLCASLIALAFSGADACFSQITI